MKGIKGIAKLGYTVVAVLAVLVIGEGHRAQAGWTGLINGLGNGWAGVHLSSSSLQTNRVQTLPNTAAPSAAGPPLSGYKTNTAAPGGAATNTFAKIKGLSGGIWQGSSNAGNSGDDAGNPELEQRIPISPADCASITFDTIINQSQAQFESNGFSGTITVNAQATAGTALWLRGFEYTGDMADVPADDPTTVQNESIEYLKVHGVQKFDIVLVGPFSYGVGNSCPLIIPFNLASGNLSNIVFATDGVAKSLPLLLNCPSNIVVNCGTPVSYGPLSYGACGDVTITYNPPVGSSFPVGTTPVTVTLADTNGISTNCTFTVTVLDNSTPTIPPLPTLTGQCSVQVPVPTATNTCGITTKVVTGTTSDPLMYNTQGTNIVHWSFNDGNGNIGSATQTVIVKDTIAPAVPVLPTINGSCSAPVTLTPPTTTDNCALTVTGTTSDPLSYTNVGTYTVHWSFNDGNGNTSTANQTVNMGGLSFAGFYSPIGTVSNACTAPVVQQQGAVLPIKFDLFCGTTPITTGTPPTVKIQLWTGCAFVSEPLSVAAVYQNNWHYNWDTSLWAKGIYKVIVLLPDGTSRYTFVKLK
jgi:hypothetical protein